MRWASPGEWPIASSSWIRGRSSRRATPSGSSPRRSPTGPDCSCPRSCRIETAHPEEVRRDVAPEEDPMTRRLALMLVAVLGGSGTRAAIGETTLEKIGRTGALTIGTRTGSPPFAYINKSNEWVGFTIDLVEQLVMPTVSKEVGKPVKLEKKESTPPTRIPLLTSNAVDLIAGTMTDTPQRRESVDF